MQIPMRSNEVFVWFYLSYLAVSLVITVAVGQTLRKNGRIFLVDAFGGDERMADAINGLLQIGFYLANVGYIALVMRTFDGLFGPRQFLEAWVPKLGGVLLILGIVHLFNMLILTRIHRRNGDGGRVEPARERNAVHTPAQVLGDAFHL
jgi:hypothetical protein